MSRVKREEKMAQMRLAAVIERLHAIATDQSVPTDEACQAAAELARTVMTHTDKIVAALKAD